MLSLTHNDALILTTSNSLPPRERAAVKRILTGDLREEISPTLQSTYVAAVDVVTANARDLHERSRWDRCVVNPTHSIERFAKAREFHDVNLFGHTLATAAIATHVTERDGPREALSAEVRSRLIVTALIHDLGELFVGDVCTIQKTSAHDALERRAFHDNFDSLFREQPIDVKQNLRYLYDTVAAADDKTSPLVQYFEAIEIIGYLNGALYAFETRPAGIYHESYIFGTAWYQFHPNPERGRPGLRALATKIPFVSHWLAQDGERLSLAIRAVANLDDEAFHRTLVRDRETLKSVPWNVARDARLQFAEDLSGMVAQCSQRWSQPDLRKVFA